MHPILMTDTYAFIPIRRSERICLQCSTARSLPILEQAPTYGDFDPIPLSNPANTDLISNALRVTRRLLTTRPRFSITSLLAL